MRKYVPLFEDLEIPNEFTEDDMGPGVTVLNDLFNYLEKVKFEDPNISTVQLNPAIIPVPSIRITKILYTKMAELQHAVAVVTIYLDKNNTGFIIDYSISYIKEGLVYKIDCGQSTENIDSFKDVKYSIINHFDKGERRLKIMFDTAKVVEGLEIPPEFTENDLRKADALSFFYRELGSEEGTRVIDSKIGKAAIEGIDRIARSIAYTWIWHTELGKAYQKEIGLDVGEKRVEYEKLLSELTEIIISKLRWKTNEDLEIPTEFTEFDMGEGESITIDKSDWTGEAAIIVINKTLKEVTVPDIGKFKLKFSSTHDGEKVTVYDEEGDELYSIDGYEFGGKYVFIDINENIERENKNPYIAIAQLLYMLETRK